MRYISLFSGIGGLDRAMDSLGGECVVQVEREPYCRSILDLRWPGVAKHEDVLDYHPALGVDLVAGGPPCQPVSHAGRRQGTADDRWLWGEALRVVREAQPARVFFENPMGLRTLGLDAILTDLTEMGYGGAWEVVAAADVGAPHLRKRIFIMGIVGREGWEGPTRPPGNRAIVWKTPTAAPWVHGGDGGELQKQVNHGNIPTPSHADGTGGPGTSPKREGGLNLRTYAAMFPTPDAAGGGRSPKGGMSATGQRADGRKAQVGLANAVVMEDRWPTPGAGDNRDRGHSQMPAIIRRRAAGRQLNLSMTVSTSSGALSPDWVEWLMGLPVGWTDADNWFPGPLYGWESEPAIPRVGLGIKNRSKRLTALGNAVVPAQAVFAWEKLTERLAQRENR